jgi:guanylate kinase
LSDIGLLLVLTGPSGAGKTLLVKRTLERRNDVRFSVSFTTRPIRAGEEHGKDYFFIESADFEARIARGEFLEHARVHGKLYGTERAQVERLVQDGATVILDIDVQGARQVRASGADAVFVFLLPPSMEVLESRLRGRGTDGDEVIAGRLGIAQKEMAEAPWFDYLLVNETLDLTVATFDALIEAERLKRRRAGTCRRLGLLGS